MGNQQSLDDAAITRLVETYSDLLLRLALHYTRSIYEAQDAVQDTFLRLVRARPQMESEEHERAWLLRTEINVCRDLARSKWKKTTVPLETEIAAPPEREPDCTLDIVRRLPERERNAVFFYYYEQRTVREIAELTDEPVGTVVSRLHRARKKLATMLEGDRNAIV